MIIKRLTTLAILFTFFVLTVEAGQPVVWETSGRTELLRGDSRGVSITDTGVLMLAPKLNEIYNTQQTYVWSSAVDSQGNVYLGTGHDGKIFKVSSAGSGSLLYDAAELDVTAIAIARDGAIAPVPSGLAARAAQIAAAAQILPRCLRRLSVSAERLR